MSSEESNSDSMNRLLKWLSDNGFDRYIPLFRKLELNEDKLMYRYEPFELLHIIKPEDPQFLNQLVKHKYELLWKINQENEPSKEPLNTTHELNYMKPTYSSTIRSHQYNSNLKSTNNVIDDESNNLESLAIAEARIHSNSYGSQHTFHPLHKSLKEANHPFHLAHPGAL